MTIYFYDEKECALIALDTETKIARALPQAFLGAVEVPPPALTPETQIAIGVAQSIRRKYTKTAKGPTGKKGPCPECGSPSRHKKVCSKASGSPVKKDHPWRASSGGAKREYISRMTFGRIKISQSHDVSAEDIARNFGVPVAEVEKAFEVESYTDYQQL